MTAELRSIYSGPIRRALDRIQRDAQGLDARPGPDGVFRPWAVPWGNIVLRRNDELPFSTPGVFNVANSTNAGVTPAVPVTLFEGRRYKMRYFCRAYGYSVAAWSYLQFAPFVDGVNRFLSMGDVWTFKASEANYMNTSGEWYFDCYNAAGAGGRDIMPGVHTLQVVALAGLSSAPGLHNFYTTGSSFVVEDVGPIV